MELGYVSDAVSAYNEALAISPDMADAQNNLGVAFLELGAEDEAEERFRSALSSDASTAELHSNLGNVLRKQGKISEARECYRRAQTLQPNDGVEIRMATLLPVIADSADEIAGARQEFRDAVGSLLKRDLTVENPLFEVGMTNFHLSYHDENNRDLQRMLGELFLKASPGLAIEAPHCDRGVVGGRQLRVGFVSRYMRTHAVGWCFHGILRFIGREGLHVTAFGFPQRPDPLWDAIVRDTDAQIMLPATLKGARDRIAQEQLDILVYTDLGMDPLTYFLAFSRLAPLQVALAGHPDTIGIATIDYYVSCDDQEPPDTAQHYSEKLVRLCRRSDLLQPSGCARAATSAQRIQAARRRQPVLLCADAFQGAPGYGCAVRAHSRCRSRWAARIAKRISRTLGGIIFRAICALAGRTD